MLAGISSRLDAIGGVGLVEDVSRAHEKLFSYFWVGLAQDDEIQDLHLSLGQAIRVCRRFGRLRLGLLLKGNYPPYQGPHAQLGSGGQGLVQQRHGLGPVAGPVGWSSVSA